MINVFVTSVIDAPIDDVWKVVRGYNQLPDWHPAIDRSEIEESLPEDTVGCIRNFYLKDGQNVREQLIALSDLDYTFSYSMLETGIGMYGYISSLELRPITDGDRTYIQWVAEFTTDKGEEDAKVNMVANDIFQGGFNALKERLSK
jgi:hypothetical protein